MKKIFLLICLFSTLTISDVVLARDIQGADFERLHGIGIGSLKCPERGRSVQKMVIEVKPSSVEAGRTICNGNYHTGEVTDAWVVVDEKGKWGGSDPLIVKVTKTPKGRVDYSYSGEVSKYGPFRFKLVYCCVESSISFSP